MLEAAPLLLVLSISHLPPWTTLLEFSTSVSAWHWGWKVWEKKSSKSMGFACKNLTQWEDDRLQEGMAVLSLRNTGRRRGGSPNSTPWALTPATHQKTEAKTKGRDLELSTCLAR